MKNKHKTFNTTRVRKRIECLFAAIYSNSSYFIFGFGAGNIYLSCIVSVSCIALLIILKHFILVHISRLHHFLFYHIMRCII